MPVLAARITETEWEHIGDRLSLSEHEVRSDGEGNQYLYSLPIIQNDEQVACKDTR